MKEKQTVIETGRVVGCRILRVWDFFHQVIRILAVASFRRDDIPSLLGQKSETMLTPSLGLVSQE